MWCNVKMHTKSVDVKPLICNREREKKTEINGVFHRERKKRDSEWASEWRRSRAAGIGMHFTSENCITEQTTVPVTHELYFFTDTKKILVHFEQCVAISLLAHVAGETNYHREKNWTTNFTFCSVMDDELSKMVIKCIHTRIVYFLLFFICWNLNEKQTDINWCCCCCCCCGYYQNKFRNISQ